MTTEHYDVVIADGGPAGLAIAAALAAPSQPGSRLMPWAVRHRSFGGIDSPSGSTPGFYTSPGRWKGGVQWLNALGTRSWFWMRNERQPGWIRAATIRLHGVIPLVETARMIPARELAFVVGQLARFLLRRGSAS